MFKTIGKAIAPGLIATSATSASFGISLAAIPAPAMAAELSSTGVYFGSAKLS